MKTLFCMTVELRKSEQTIDVCVSGSLTKSSMAVFTQVDTPPINAVLETKANGNTYFVIY